MRINESECVLGVVRGVKKAQWGLGQSAYRAQWDLGQSAYRAQWDLGELTSNEVKFVSRNAFRKLGRVEGQQCGFRIAQPSNANSISNAQK